MAAVLDDMPPGIATSETRGNDGSSPEREVDLASMGMAGERQGHAVVDLGEDVGIVGEGYRRGAVGEIVENRAHVPFRLPQVAESDEVADVVKTLEEQYDSFTEAAEADEMLQDGRMPTADELGAAFEHFLAERNKKDDD